MEAFFRDYGQPFATLIAVLNTVISVTIAQFFSANRTARIILVAGSALLGVVAVGGTFYSQHAIVAGQQSEAARRETIREGLARLIEAGEGLKNQFSDPSAPTPLDATADWEKQVEAFLNAQLGKSYVIRFRSRTGVQSLVLSGGDEVRKSTWFRLHAGLFRLNEFSQQLAL
ncbi:MAG: hypothetical protein ABSC25_03205 [Roseiarcus sp.]|jgi:hypothetical protein